MKRFLLLLLFCGMSLPAAAQFYPTQYRPGNLNWQQLQTPHFKIVYPKTEDSLAWRAGQILEHQMGAAEQLVGGSLQNFPVILNNYNDRSNGFVTSLHFRSEVDVQNFKSKSMNPRTGSWLETVLPHELVHAMQLSNTGGFGIGGAVNLIGPDMARSFHGAIPYGVLEGLAVHHESEEITPNGGRGNYPWFMNQFNALFNSADRWSMGQMVQVSSRTRPFNRHYIGGYAFTSWLQNKYGEDTSREALDFYIDLPLLGYGVALKHATGKWPNELYDEFENEKQIVQQSLKTHTSVFPTLDLPFEGTEVRRPKWLDDSTLLFHGSFYNARAGFYTYNLNTEEVTPLLITGTVGDFAYDLSADRNKLIFAYYKAHPIYENTFKTRIAELDISSGKIVKEWPQEGQYAPEYTSTDEILALEHQYDWNRLVAHTKENGHEVLADIGPNRFTELSVSPVNQDRWAVVANRDGLQGLWIVNRESVEQDLESSPDISFLGGSVFDPAWHPDGNSLLFTADIDGSMNVYEYDLENDRVLRLTDTRYNSYEPSYSPSGNRIALIQQQGNEQRPAILTAENYINEPVDQDRWKPSAEKESFVQRPKLGSEIDTTGSEWERDSYQSGISWLKPRIFLPVFEEIGNSDVYRAGIGLHSNNLLQNQSYSLDFSYAQSRGWYDFTYSNKQFFPGFKARLFSQPSFVTHQLETETSNTLRTFLTQQRSMALSVPTRITLENNVRFSSLFFEPEIRRTQVRYFELDHEGEPASNFADLTIANLFASFSYKLQQNIRDVQANSGFILFSELEYYLSSGSLILETLGNRYPVPFPEPYALRGGFYTYLSPLSRWNQSLRLGVLATKQSNVVFSNNFLVSDGFSERIFPMQRDLLSISTRYTIPLTYPDDGGFLLPAYLSNIYLVAFTNTVAPYQAPNMMEASRTVFGAGIRAQFRLSNLSFDIGIGFGFEPSRNKGNLFVGNF